VEIEDAIQQYLAADAGVTPLVGSGSACRIYPQQGLQDTTRPFVCFVASDPEQRISVGGVPMNFYFVRMRFDVYADAGDYASAKAVARAIRGGRPAADTGLLGLQGDIAGGGATIRGVFDDGGQDELEPPLLADELGLPSVSVGVRIYYGLA
jgi:Protein of unknown function (DUF3168)